MSDLVDSTEIEAVVGVPRDPVHHYARAVSAEQTVYVLHSHACLTSGIDLRDCAYSLALDRGIDLRRWYQRQDAPMHVRIDTATGRLVPGREPGVFIEIPRGGIAPGGSASATPA